MRMFFWIVLLAVAALPMFGEDASAFGRRQRRCRQVSCAPSTCCSQPACATPTGVPPVGLAEPAPKGPPIE